MLVTKENLQKGLKLHTEWRVYQEWKSKDEKTRGAEPPKGKRFVSDAELTGADLRGANLIGAMLTGADLRGANLTGAELRDADLTNAILMDANLSYANLSDANLIGATLPDNIPIIPNIDTQILEAVKKCGLDMSSWHCGTTHCRAGWAIHLAGEKGYALQEKVGSQVAGALIYMASRPHRKHPDFFCDNGQAMKSIEEDAQEEREKETKDV